jgi:PST family polysaccharide transporter
MSLGERAIKGVLGFGAVNTLVFAGSFIIQILLARLLSPEIFGVVAFALAIRKIATVPANWGLSEAIMQETEYDNFLETLLWVRAGFAAILVGIVVTAGILLRPVFDTTLINIVIILFAVAGLSMIGHVFRAFRQRDLGLSMLGVVDLVALVAAGGTGIWLALSQKSVWALVVYYGLRDVLRAIGYIVISPQYPSGEFNPQVVPWLYDFAKGMIATKTMEDVGQRGDDYLIGVLGSTATLGAYTVAWRLAKAYTLIVQPAIRAGILPTFSRLKGSSEQSRRGLEFISRLQIHLSVPVYVVAYFAAPTAIPLLFGSDWQSAVPIFRTLSVAAILFPIHATAKQFYYSRGQSKIVFRAQVASIITMMIGMVVLIPLLDGVGAALAVNAMLAVGVIFLFWRLRYDPGVSVSRMAISSIFGSIAAFGVGLATTPYIPGGNNLIELLTYIPIGLGMAISYGLVVFVLDRTQVISDLGILKRAVFD